MSEVQEQPKNEALLSLRDTGPNSLVERADDFILNMTRAAEESESLVPTANEFTVTSETEFQFADEMAVELETSAKGDEAARMYVTRFIDDLKNYLISVAKPAVVNKRGAAAIYRRKALDFRRQVREEAEKSRREAEAEQRRKQEALNAAATKREAEVAKLRTEAGRQKAQAEADALREAALHTTTSMAVSAPAPQSTASNYSDKWLWNIDNLPAFIKWLSEHAEWLNEKGFNNCVIGAKIAAMNKMVNHYADTLEIPGVRVWSEEASRKKPTRQS